jgi:hypothetical protein
VVEYVDHYAPTKARGDAQHARADRLVTSDQPTRVKHRAWLAAPGR